MSSLRIYDHKHSNNAKNKFVTSTRRGHADDLTGSKAGGCLDELDKLIVYKILFNKLNEARFEVVLL